MLNFEELLTQVRLRVAEDAAEEPHVTPRCIRIPSAKLLEACRLLFNDPSCYFDMLSCITAVDNGPAIGSIDVIYNLYSIPFNSHLSIKVVLSRESAAIDSVASIWRTADWHEREAYDLLGVTFNGHPDLRRILLPADWEGHPLRKDYKHQEHYRSIKVEY